MGEAKEPDFMGDRTSYTKDSSLVRES